ncbi:MAG: TlpA disulfide reductase family protein [Acidobacteriota bacterium]
MIIVACRQFFFLALSLIILLSGFSASAQSPRKGAAKLRVSSAHPAVVKAIDLEGLKVVLKRDASRPLLVNFWATWCDPCREEFPDLVKIDNEYRSKGLDFIAISLDDLAEIKTEVPKFLRAMGAKMPAYLLNVSDPEPAIKLVDPQWSGALPATVLYNGKGEIVFKYFGRVKPDELRAAIDKEVGSKKASGEQ